MNYFEEEHEWVRKNFDLEEILDFTKKHSFEITRESDYMFFLWVDRNSRGGWGCTLTPMMALVKGIKEYKEYNNENSTL